MAFPTGLDWQSVLRLSHEGAAVAVVIRRRDVEPIVERQRLDDEGGR